MAILTVPELRAHVTSSLGDPALQMLLNAAEQAVITQAGAGDAVTEFGVGGYSTFILRREAATVTTVTETIGGALGTPTVLDPSDYRVSGYVLTRLETGPNPRSTWADLVEVTHTPRIDDSERQRVVLELVRLDLTYQPGLAGQAIGDWSESYSGSSDYKAEREAILASLGGRSLMRIAE